jgi:hypothetical protein
MFQSAPAHVNAAARAAFPKAQAIRAPVRQIPPNAGIQTRAHAQAVSEEPSVAEKLPKIAQF